MKLARPILAALTVGVVLAVIFTIFAIELASGQDRSRNQIKTEVQDRAVLTASLIDTLFGTIEQSKVQYRNDYSDPIDTTALAKAAANGPYAVVTDSQGRPLAFAGKFTDQSSLTFSREALAQIATKAAAAPGALPYQVGDLRPFGQSWVADVVEPFQAKDGSERLFVIGVNPALLQGAIFGPDLSDVPGVKGETNYLVDGAGRIISSSNQKLQVGSQIAQPRPALLVKKSGVDQGYYFQSASLEHSSWRVLLVAPDSALFASVNGARAFVPWIVFAALVAAAALAVLLGWRVLRSAEVVSEVNAKLATVNEELSVANEALQHRAAELARSNEELESFASIASHDLQEPLRKVRTFTEQLTVIEADRLSEKGKDYLGRANAAAERMQKLIEDLLKFSRVSTQGRPFEPVDLADVTARVLSDLENQAEDAGARIDVGPLPTIAADPLQMQQLMQNLISNAIKFRRPDVPPEVRIRGEVKSGKLHLTVSDNGIGFEPRYSARIFRIFERLHGRTEYPGTGIGLALCRKIADRHGGTIEAESELGHGATFSVTLPVEQPHASLGYSAGSPRPEEVVAGAGV